MKALEKWNRGTSNTVFQQYFSSLLEGMCCILTDMLLWLLRSPISDRPGDCWGDGRGGGGGYCILTDTLLFAEVTRSCPAWQSLEGVAVVAGEGGYWRIAVVEGKGVGGVTAYWPTDALLWLKGRGWGGYCILNNWHIAVVAGVGVGGGYCILTNWCIAVVVGKWGWGGYCILTNWRIAVVAGKLGGGGVLHTNQLTHCCGWGERVHCWCCGERGGGLLHTNQHTAVVAEEGLWGGGGGGYCILTNWHIAVVAGKGVGVYCILTDTLLWLQRRGCGGGVLHTNQLTHCCGWGERVHCWCCGERGGGLLHTNQHTAVVAEEGLWGGGVLHTNQLTHCCGCGELGGGGGGVLHTNQLTHCCGCGETGGGGGGGGVYCILTNWHIAVVAGKGVGVYCILTDTLLWLQRRVVGGGTAY